MHIVDMFRDTLQLLVETLNNLFTVPADLKTPRATRTPIPTAEKKQKSKEVAGESSTPRKYLKVTIKQMQPGTTLILSPSNYEEEDSYACDFDNSIFKDEEDIRTRIEPGSHKEHPKIVDEDNDVVEKKTTDDDKKDDNNDRIDHALVRSEVPCSLETRNEQMQTPIPLPPRSPRTGLSLDNVLSQELQVTVSHTCYYISRFNQIKTHFHQVLTYFMSSVRYKKKTQSPRIFYALT
nr:hypothetical protein [Tanacetum cinerariifolium]